MKRLKSIVAVACAALVAVVIALPAAQPVSAQSSAALSIVPRKNYTIEPGNSINDTLTIRNMDTERTLELTMRVIDFTFTDDGGSPQLYLAEDAPQTTWSLKPFLNVPTSVTVDPNSSTTVNMSVSIPENQGAGSYYSAIMYSSGSSDGGNVGLNASGVTLVFTSIPGTVDEKLTLEKFGAYFPATTNKKAGYAFLTADEPLNMAFTLKNDGNVTEAPVGSITLKNIFGPETTITDVNPNSSLALIGQTRTFTACIKKQSQNVDFNGTRADAVQCVSPGLWPGMYTATLDLFYGQNGNRTQEISKTAVFWYLPWWFVIFMLVVLAVIAYFIWRIVQKVRNRRYGARPKNLTRRRR